MWMLDMERDIGYEINNLIQEKYWVNYVTCGHCWNIFNHPVGHEWYISCPWCKQEMEQCDCPDLFI